MESILAYIDPGTGSVIAQALASAALTIAFFFRKLVTAPFRAAVGWIIRRKPATDLSTQRALPPSTAGAPEEAPVPQEETVDA